MKREEHDKGTGLERKSTLRPGKNNNVEKKEQEPQPIFLPQLKTKNVNIDFN